MKSLFSIVLLFIFSIQAQATYKLTKNFPIMSPISAKATESLDKIVFSTPTHIHVMGVDDQTTLFNVNFRDAMKDMGRRGNIHELGFINSKDDLLVYSLHYSGEALFWSVEKQKLVQRIKVARADWRFYAKASPDMLSLIFENTLRDEEGVAHSNLQYLDMSQNQWTLQMVNDSADGFVFSKNSQALIYHSKDQFYMARFNGSQAISAQAMFSVTKNENQNTYRTFRMSEDGNTIYACGELYGPRSEILDVIGMDGKIQKSLEAFSESYTKSCLTGLHKADDNTLYGSSAWVWSLDEDQFYSPMQWGGFSPGPIFAMSGTKAVIRYHNSFKPRIYKVGLWDYSKDYSGSQDPVDFHFAGTGGLKEFEIPRSIVATKDLSKIILFVGDEPFSSIQSGRVIVYEKN